MITEQTKEVDFEKTLIAALIADPSQFDNVTGSVSERDFDSKALRAAFKTLAVMREANDPSGDTAVLLHKLRATGMTISEITEVATGGIAAHASYYAKQVREAGRLRRLRFQLAAVMDNLELDNTSETVKRIEDMLEDYQATESTGLVTLAQAGEQLLEEMARDQQSRPTCFSGIQKMDDIVGGFRPGEMVVLAARPGVGKTSLAMQFAMHNAKQGRSGLFVSLEMKATELAGRIFCGLTKVDPKYFRQGCLSKDELRTIAETIDDLRDLNLFIYDPSAANIQRIRAIARLAKLRHDIQFLAVDYIGLVDPSERGLPRHESVGEVSRKLKQLAKELELPVFALAQLNRAADGSEPMLSNLRDSGSIEQDADAVMFLHRKNEESAVELIIAKHRHGQQGRFDLTFDGASTRFSDGSEPPVVKWPVG